MKNGESGEQDSTGKKKALVVGVSDYAYNLQSLDFCKKDGEEIYKILKSIGYEIPDSHKLVGHVNYETMKDRIYDFFTDTNTKSEDVLLFYYSGHGVPDVNGDVFLASSEINHDAPFRKGFSFYELTNTIERSNSTRIVTILDCCYSGAAKISKGHEEDAARLGTAAIDDKSKRLLQQGEGKCLLAASMGYQEAYGLKEKGHSIFTYYLLEGFKGAKSAVDEEGNITPDTLGKFVFREIVNLPEGKRPKQKPIRKVEAGGDIILAQYPELVKKEPMQDPYESIQDATEYLKKADYTSAVQYSDKALAINPRISVVYSIKGQALYNLKKYDEALICYNKALDLRAKDLEVLSYKALTLTALGKYSEAIVTLNQSTDLNPNDATIWNSKGLAFSQIGKYNEAIECFDKAIKLNPTYTEALRNEHTALSNLRQGRHEEREKEEKEQQQGQISSRINGDVKIDKAQTSTPTVSDTRTVDIAHKESSSDSTIPKDVPISVISPEEKRIEEEKSSKPKKTVQSPSPVSSSTNKAPYPVSGEVIAGQTLPGTTKNDTLPHQKISEEYDERQRSPIGSSLKSDTGISKSVGYTSASSSGEEGKREDSTMMKQSRPKNLKILIPIIIAGVVGSIIAFAIFGTTTTPPETTTPETTTPETTPTSQPETTTTPTPLKKTKTPTPTFETYENSDISVQIPSNWETAEESGVSVYEPGQQNLGEFSVPLPNNPNSYVGGQVKIYAENLDTPITLEEYTDKIIEEIEDNNGVLIESASTTLSGNPAHKVVYSTDDSTHRTYGKVFTISSYPYKDDKAYTIEYPLEDDQLGSSNYQSTLQKVIESLEIKN